MALNDTVFQKALNKTKKTKIRTIDGVKYLHVHQEPPEITLYTSDNKQNKNNSPSHYYPDRGIDRGMDRGMDRGIKSNGIVNNNLSTDLTNKTVRSYISFYALSKTFIDVIYKLCLDNGSRETMPLSFKTIVSLCNSNNNSLKKCRKRLIENNILKTRSFGKGSVRLTVYSITKIIYEEIKNINNSPTFRSNTLTCYNQERGTNRGIDRGIEPVYSSSNNINTTTEELPEQWVNLTISPLEHIGFSVTQLKQLSKLGCCNTEVIQDAIYQFAYDLEYNNLSGKLKTSPLNALMGVLRKGQGWNAHNYKPPQDIALGKILERKKQEQASREKQLKELYSLGFDEWLSSKTDDELKDIYLKQAGSGANFFKYGGVSNAPTRAGLSKYFEENVWVNKIQDLNSYKN